MSAATLSMRKLREIFRLHFEKALSQRAIATSCAVGATGSRYRDGGRLGKLVVGRAVEAHVSGRCGAVLAVRVLAGTSGSSGHEACDELNLRLESPAPLPRRLASWSESRRSGAPPVGQQEFAFA
jgi:hypothetical protein